MARAAAKHKQAPTEQASRRKVCVMAYEGLCTFEFGIAVEVFGLARPELDVAWYDFQVVAVEPGPLAAIGGVTVEVEQGLAAAADADLILLPGWRGSDQPVPLELRQCLRAAHARGATIASICSGVFVLAATGLLSGRRATTHWRYADNLQQAYPDIDVQADVLYVDEGTIITSAGSAAGLDMCLHIVRRDYGTQIGNSVARRLVLPAHRQGGQAQFVPRPAPPRDLGALAPILDHLRKSLNEDWPVERIAERAAVSPRTLLRRFQDTTGLSPNAWLTMERVAYARELLETTDLGVAAIALTCGFGAPETLRHHFRRMTGTAPLTYRKAFRD